MDDTERLIELTKQIYTKKEKESLKKMALQITNVPDSITIPIEYMVGNEK